MVGGPAGGEAHVEGFSTRDALTIGAAQALALNPGTSRSGITITASRFAGFDRDAAARISFLMSLPVTAGAVVLKMPQLLSDGIPDGLLGADDRRHPRRRACRAGSRCGARCELIRTRSFTPFVVYRIALGVVVLGIVRRRLALTRLRARGAPPGCRLPPPRARPVPRRRGRRST